MKNRHELLTFEADRWRETQEHGHNRGGIIELFQRATDGKAHGEAWCMSFVQYCLKEADNLFNFLTDYMWPSTHEIFRSEHCLSCWNTTPKHCRSSEPKKGYVVIWKRKNSSWKGHTGIVVSYDDDYIWTIEGNTSDSGAINEIVRDGDGVYLKKRSRHDFGSFDLVGYLNPWPR